MSRPPKPFDETKGRISLSPKRENIEYVKVKHGNASAWFDTKAEEEQADDPVVRRAVRAQKLRAMKTNTDDLTAEFVKEEGCSPDEAITEYQAAKTRYAELEKVAADNANEENLRRLVEGTEGRTGRPLVYWLSDRGEDFGFKQPARELADLVEDYRRRKGDGL